MVELTAILQLAFLLVTSFVKVVNSVQFVPSLEPYTVPLLIGLGVLSFLLIISKEDIFKASGL